MFRKFGIVAGIVLVLGIVYFFVSDITRKDVIAANSFSHESATEPLRAGDIVVLGETGAVSKLCDAVLSNPAAPEPRAAVYYNRSSRILQEFVDVGHGLGFFPDRNPVIVHGSIPFLGDSETLDGVSYNYANPDLCECAIVRSLAQGERVCTVNASLIETGEVLVGEGGKLLSRPIHDRTVAVTLRRHVVYMPPETFASCGVEPGEALVTQQRLCDSNPRLPLDVRLRRSWNLIDREPLPGLLVEASAPTQ
ncbi:hypothetical protein [Salipiger mangrovisoli]|uniref:SAF domain-containing protein n=1 Tax=Salipiger mangrovisoli TaxID=2865933 RepID=A0ABR9X7G0_9RHOB|nr:hypothetical protein [Salipiger mangrovisoli]MBE9639535.1 hypothetical protein [Salipiger mangrovisoli]